MPRVFLESMPPSQGGEKIGLFGGSFNPPHEGHLLVAQLVLSCLALDKLWWMITPGNPLKINDHLPSLAQRAVWSQELLAHSLDIDITAFEASIGVQRSFETLTYILEQHKTQTNKFVWIIGSDSLANFHLWYRWQDLAAMVPIAVVQRPGTMSADTDSIFASCYKARRVPQEEAATLVFKKPPAWCYLQGELSEQSSTNLRMINNANK